MKSRVKAMLNGLASRVQFIAAMLPILVMTAGVSFQPFSYIAFCNRLVKLPSLICHCLSMSQRTDFRLPALP